MQTLPTNLGVARGALAAAGMAGAGGALAGSGVTGHFGYVVRFGGFSMRCFEKRLMCVGGLHLRTL